MSRFYDDLDTFFAARRLRRAYENSSQGWLEDSHDYGVHWRDRQGARYRLTWIGTTHRAEGDGGELYLLRLNSTASTGGAVEFLCVIAPVTDWVGRRHNPAENVEGILTGWAEVCGEEGSIDWVRDGVLAAIEAGWASAP